MVGLTPAQNSNSPLTCLLMLWAWQATPNNAGHDVRIVFAQALTLLFTHHFLSLPPQDFLR